jgi:hypothetical protein
MRLKFIIAISILVLANTNTKAQNITYSEVEKNDNRNMNFEILGKFSDNILIYKNLNRSHKISIYDNVMAIKESIKLDFVSDRTINIDFIKYTDNFLMIWQYERGNVTYCNGAKMDGNGKVLGNVLLLDSTKIGLFGNKVYYTTTWSEDKKKILVYKTQTRSNSYNLVTKVFDENFLLQDSTRSNIDFNSNRESFGDLQINNEGTYAYVRLKENARQEYINSVEVNFKKLKSDSLFIVQLPLDKQLVQEPLIKIDNLNGNFLLNTFSYRKNGGNINGILSTIISSSNFAIKLMQVNNFDDSLRLKLSGRPDWRSAYDNYYLKNIVLKKDGGFVLVAEEYYKQNRFNNSFSDRFNNGFGYGGFGSVTDYYLYNRGYNGFYRPFGDSPNGRDITYNYNDVIAFNFSKDLKLQLNNVINKTTSDVETDNFLSFFNMNAGAEIHFLFLQKDNNRQIISNHALQPDGSITRYATVKSREAGYSFMPRLARQIGAKQIVIPCLVRNNIAFAKIDF